jgi:hypothetical protein
VTRALTLCLVCGAAPPALAQEMESELYARVIVERTVVRSGPGVGYRSVYVAERGEVFPLVSRATRGYWFQVELPDRTLGFILGDAVYNHEVGDGTIDGGRPWPWLFAPPPLPAADGEVAITAGVLGSGGVVSLRPSLLLSPGFGFELTGSAAVATGGRLLLATAGPIVNLFARSPIVPFATVQAGVTASSPNADTFLLESGAVATLTGGIGLRFGFHYRLTLRLEARAYAFFEPDRLVAQEEYSAGLTVFF